MWGADTNFPGFQDLLHHGHRPRPPEAQPAGGRGPLPDRGGPSPAVCVPPPTGAIPGDPAAEGREAGLPGALSWEPSAGLGRAEGFPKSRAELASLWG